MDGCNKCVLPRNYPGIKFDDSGACNYCLSHEKVQALGEELLEEVLGRYRGIGEKWDALVPVSGGKDSTFTLYWLSRFFKGRVLAYHYDNGFSHEQAKENLENMTNSLDVPLIKVEKNQSKYVMEFLSTWLDKMSHGMIPLLCLGCRYGIVGGAYSTAKEKDIPLIVMSDNISEASPFKSQILRKKGGRELGGLFLEVAVEPRYIVRHPILTTLDYLHNYSNVRANLRVLRLLHPKTNLIHFYDYVRFDEDNMMATLTSNTGWKVPEDAPYSWRFNCRIKLIKDILYLCLLGFTEMNDYLSFKIREKEISREEALGVLEKSQDLEGLSGKVQQVLAEIKCSPVLRNKVGTLVEQAKQ
ncbi:hypothetical protein KY366_07155 [Candidatus Woesearchaeota archaeon]|nr:hypothetical protein [Candidatus Woesearchaeota archaeon]